MNERKGGGGGGGDCTVVPGYWESSGFCGIFPVWPG